ncbi:hypothetical protein [Rhodobaculum claviforme]|uniref:PLD phosphodiesterase domain-containing protein n=1 Tax=Rhodobaculum claviforme TaxID=1549854 RepID=A0A934TKZ6_9RHOB|nr:hypothetical protein [Rhodobaculum claviforme]MBK5927474.1 hypothetical protein [Rhodobaculum claviforme]
MPAELFGPGAATRDDLRIICDIGMGGTNPEALITLGAPRRDGLRHCSNMHAKVYLSDAGLVMGSANASANGIGLNADAAGLTEAGTFSTAHSPAWEAAATWFENLWTRAAAVDADAMDRAWKSWRLRSRTGDTGEHDETPARRFLDYDPERDGLVYVGWYSGQPEPYTPPGVANVAHRNDVPLGTLLAPNDTDVMGVWMLDVCLDGTRAVRQPAPELIFLNARHEDPGHDAEYPMVYYQRTDAPPPPAPFQLDDRLRHVVLDVINRKEFGALRDRQHAQP